jgi:GTPase SAR1 family protein
MQTQQIGVDFALKVINWDDKSIVRLQLWDIAGQERFGNMTRVRLAPPPPQLPADRPMHVSVCVCVCGCGGGQVYYKEAVGAFVVFDVTRISTFEGVLKWKHDINAKVTLPPDNRPIPVVLLANKCDLNKEGFCQDKSKMDKFCEENGFIGWSVPLSLILLLASN